MPRPSRPSDMADGAPRKRAPRAPAKKTAAPRSRVSKSVSASSEAVTKTAAVERPQRKAPTVIQERVEQQRRSGRRYIVIAVISFILLGVGVAIGFTDPGQIDVVAIVNERNEKISRGEVRDEVTGETVTATIPVQSTDTRPNGGRRISETQQEPAPAPAETTPATSTEEMASSTASTTETSVQDETSTESEESVSNETQTEETPPPAAISQ